MMFSKIYSWEKWGTKLFQSGLGKIPKIHLKLEVMI